MEIEAQFADPGELEIKLMLTLTLQEAERLLEQLKPAESYAQAGQLKELLAKVTTKLRSKTAVIARPIPAPADD